MRVPEDRASTSWRPGSSRGDDARVRRPRVCDRGFDRQRRTMIGLVRNGDVDRGRAALKPITEKERRAIAPTAIRIVREERAPHIAAAPNKAWPAAR